MAHTFTRTGAQIEEIHNTVDDPKSNAQFSDDIRTIAGEYRGLWPDTGGSANKGDTYQTQTSGTPTGQYFTALQNTTVDPVSDDVNWREVVSVDSFSKYTDIVYKASAGNSAVENMIAGTPVSLGVGDTCACENGSRFERVAVNGDFSDFQIIGFAVINDFGASSSKTTSENKAILDALVLSLDGTRANITIGPDINYGYTRLVESTWPESVYPQMSDSIETNIYIADFSKGDPNTSNPGSRSGMQFREWLFTGKEQDGQHNGDFRYLNSNWHGGQVVYHNGGDEMLVANGGAGKNRRASYMTGVKGEVFWRFGQGGFTDDTMSDQELANFLVSANGIPDIGVTGLTTCYAINKTDGMQGWNISQPRFAFDFVSRIGQSGVSTFGFETPEGEPTILLQGETGQLRFITKPTSGFSLNDSTSSLYDVSPSGAIHTLRRHSGGSVFLKLQSTSTQRNISINDTDSEFRITNAAGTSNTLRHTEAGNLTITGSYSPFTGTHLFFCPNKIEEGLAVDLVDATPVDYIEHIEQESDYIERIEHIEAVKPPRLKGESDEEYNDRCAPAHDRVHVDVIESDPIEKVTRLNGIVSLCNTPQSKICAGIVEHQVPMEGGYLTYIAAVGDNKTESLKGFRTTGDFEAGDILCTDVDGLLAKSPEGLSRSVVVFKAMSDPDKDGRCYGYFIG